VSDSFFDKFIADLVKGAENTQGFMRGGRVTVEVQREPRGREEKLAADTSTLIGGLPFMGPSLAGLNAAAHDGSMGSGLLTGGGAGLGQLLGTVGGGALGAAAGHGVGSLAGIDEEKARIIGALLGALGGNVGGGMLGAAGGRALGAPNDKRGAFEASYVDGIKAAATAFRLKEAFLQMIGALAGPMLARAGIGAAAKRVGGGMLGNMARKVAPKIQGGMGGAAFDMAGSLAGQAAGDRLQGQPSQ
jgi:hypothetical protein